MFFLKKYATFFPGNCDFSDNDAIMFVCLVYWILFVK